MSGPSQSQRPSVDQEQGSASAGPAAAAGEQEQAQGQLAQVDIAHSDLTIGELEDVQAEAENPTEPESAGVLAEHSQYQPIPTAHSDYLIAQCDEVIDRSQEALEFAADRGWDQSQHQAQLQQAEAGRQQVVDDKNTFVEVNGRIPVVLSAMNLFDESNQYSTELVAELRDRVGLETVQSWIRNPLPDEIRQQIDESTAGAGPLGSGESLQTNLGMDEPDQNDPLTAAAQDINGLRVEILGTAEQLDSAASMQLSAMRQADARGFQAEIDEIDSIKSSYGTLVSLCKGTVDLASGNWFGPLVDAMDGIVGLIADHQAAMVQAQQKGAEWDAVHAQMDSGISLASGARSSMRGQSEQLESAVGDYQEAERDIRAVRDARRNDLMQVGAAAEEGGDSASGDIAARLLLVGAIIETAVQAHYVRDVIQRNNLAEDDINTLWQETVGSREENPCASELRYVYTTEEAQQRARGLIGVWSWTHPSEDDAFQSIADMTGYADRFSQGYLEQLGEYPTAAQALLRDALDGMARY